MNTAIKNDTQNPSVVIDYKVMTKAIANAALSRRAALQMELAVSLVHFTQESGGTDTIGKANMKAVYHDAGYCCMTKADRDYMTVNRRLNAMAKLFDKLGSSLVHTWMEGQTKTASILDKVQAELLAYNFYTLDDVLAYVGVNTNRDRAPRQPSGPVTVTAKVPETGPVAAPATFDVEAAYTGIITSMSPDEIRTFCPRLLVKVAEVETALATAKAPMHVALAA